VLVGAVHHSFHDGKSAVAKKAVGLLLVVGALVLRGGAMNAGPTGALWVGAGWEAPPKSPEVEWALRFDSRQGLPTLEATLEKAKAEGRPVMIDFFAEWCAACKELDRHTYVAPKVAKAAERFVNIKVDATADDDVMEKLFSRFGVQGLPTVAFIGSSGELLQNPRVTGFLPPEQFLTELARVP
jgi:thiol:disulfide interchange protein DsbD